MKAENIQIRQEKIRQFAITLGMFVIITGIVFYWGLVRIPNIYRQSQLLSTVQIENFRIQLLQVDTLAQQIQYNVYVKEKSMMDFYEWINKIKGMYPKPIHHSILNGYLSRVQEIEMTRQKDTLIEKLGTDYQRLQNEIKDIQAQNESLKQELVQKKVQKQS